MSAPASLGVPRAIVAVDRETPQAVVVALDCGHRRHVRHRPPLSEHPWVLDDGACERRIGVPIECPRCLARELPEGLRAYRQTRMFDQETIPAALLGEHRTKVGVWGRLVVDSGCLELRFEAPLSVAVEGRSDAPVVIPPQLLHRVRLAGPVRFHVEFLRVLTDPG